MECKKPRVMTFLDARYRWLSRESGPRPPKNPTVTVTSEGVLTHTVCEAALLFRHPCFRQGGLKRGCPRPTVVSIILYAS